MSESKIAHCLTFLRHADDILMQEDEVGLAAHLSLVIERLTMLSMIQRGSAAVPSASA